MTTAEYQARHKAKRMAAGLCTHAGCRLSSVLNRKGKTGLYCEDHKEWRRIYHLKYYHEHKSAQDGDKTETALKTDSSK